MSNTHCGTGQCVTDTSSAMDISLVKKVLTKFGKASPNVKEG